MYFSLRFCEIGYIGATVCLLSFTGVMLLCTLPEGPIKLLGYYLCPVTAGYVLLVTSVSNNVSGYTKKIFYNGCILSSLCVGNIIGPLLMTQSDSPRYTRALSIYMAADIVAVILFLVVRWIHTSANKQKQKLLEKEDTVSVECHGWQEQTDLTDVEDRYFIYRA